MNQSYSVLTTDWGYVVAVWSDRGLWEMSFPRPEVQPAVAQLSAQGLTAGAQATLTAALDRDLKLFFAGVAVEFTVPIDWTGYTLFQSAVLQYTAGIAYGQVRTYGEVAAAIGSAKAARAVGGALHINRTPIVVPCHRVIGADGSLTGFGGGLALKQALLALEEGKPATPHGWG